MQRARDRLAHLERIDVRQIHLTGAGVAALQALGCEVIAGDQRDVDQDDPEDRYVADCGNGRICKIEGGVVSTVAGGRGFADGPFDKARFACPISVDLDGAGHLYVADVQNRRIRVLNLNP